MIKGALRGSSEEKYFIVNINNTAILNTGNVFALLDGLIEGDELSQRNGREITGTKAFLRFSAFLPVLAVTGVLRVFVVQDNFNTGVIPTILEVLNSTVVDSEPNPTSSLNKRFSWLYDRSFPMVIGGANQQIHADVPITLLKKKIGFNGPAAGTTSLGRNTVFLYAISDVAAPSQPQLKFNFGIRYNDH